MKWPFVCCCAEAIHTVDKWSCVLVVVVSLARCREGRWKRDVDSDVKSYMARLSGDADVTDAVHPAAGFSHPSSHSAGSRGHERPRWFRRLPVRAGDGVRSPAGSVCAGKLDGSTSSCALHIHSPRPDRLLESRLSWDRSFYLDPDGRRGLSVFTGLHVMYKIYRRKYRL